MHTSGRTQKRIAAGLAVGVGVVLMFGACGPTVDADHTSGSSGSNTLPSSAGHYDDTDDEIDADADYVDSDEDVSSEADSDSDDYADTDASESDGSDSGGYIGSSEWVLDRSEREMWNSYEDRINNW